MTIYINIIDFKKKNSSTNNVKKLFIQLIFLKHKYICNIKSNHNVYY